MEQIEQVLDTELAAEGTEETPAGAEAMEEAGIALARLSSGEIRRLEKADIQVEEDLEFTAAMQEPEDIQEPYEPEPEGAPAGEPETEVETGAERSQEPGTEPEPVIELEPEAEPEREAEQQEEVTGQGEAKKKAEAAVEWNLTAVHAQPDTTEAAAGEPVKIAVLDSGINYRPDLPVAGHVSMLEGKEEGNPVFEDTSGHGTGVASLIGGLPGGEGIRGMNQAASVYCVQVLDGEKGKLSGIVRGIYWSIENGMDMINMSFGTGQDSEILHKAVRDASQAGLLIIAAAGNGGGTRAMYPAAYQEVISAGSSDMSGEIAEGSVRGSQVDLYAPGERILVDSPLFGTQEQSGTSLAAAEVTAAASILLEKEKGKGAEFVRRLLEKTANPALDPGEENGLLDLEEAQKKYEDFQVQEAETEEKEQEEEHRRELTVFGEGEVEALWQDQAHEDLIPGIASGRKLMLEATTFPDDNNVKLNQLYFNRRFHGSKNYKVTLNFLVNLAHAYYGKDSGAVNAIYSNPGNGLNSVEKKSNGESYLYTTVDAIQWFLNSVRLDTVVDQTTQHNKAYKIMGVAAHLVGDIYAHRTMVTDAMLQQQGLFEPLDFSNWKGFCIDAMQGRVEFRNIENYLSNPKSGTKNELYEDNVNKVPSRYQNARAVVEDLLRDKSPYDFRTHGYSGTVLKKTGTLYPY